MNILAQKWVEALRSGRYKQTQNYLKRGDGYCCLGVACDLFLPEAERYEGHDSNGETTYYFDGAIGDLPDSLMEALGLHDESGSVYHEDKLTSLAELNDNGYSFGEIADIIESQPHGLFKANA